MKPAQAAKLQIEVFRRLTPEQRIDIALRWTEGTYEIMRSAIRSQHPDWSRAQIDREIGRRISGIDVTMLDWSRCAPPPSPE
jgi:hypothetical protein